MLQVEKGKDELHNKNKGLGYPDGPMVYALQWKGHWFDPWSGKISHVLGQLSQCAKTTEPMSQSPCSATKEATAMRSLSSETREWPLLPIGESLWSAAKTQRSQKKKKKSKGPWQGKYLRELLGKKQRKVSLEKNYRPKLKDELHGQNGEERRERYVKDDKKGYTISPTKLVAPWEQRL